MSGDRYNSSWQECPICFEEYNPSNKLPVIWHNTHLTCKPCFYSLNKLCCVMCRQKHNLELYEATGDDMCSVHRDQLYSHFCENHNVLVCNQCLRETHASCECRDTVQLKKECNSKIGRLLEELDILKEFIYQRIQNTSNDLKCLELFKAGVKSFIEQHMKKLTEEQTSALFTKIDRYRRTLCDNETLIPVRDSLEDIHHSTFTTENVVKIVRMAKDTDLEEKVRSLKDKALRPLELIFEKIIHELKSHDVEGVLTNDIFFPVLYVDTSPSLLSSVVTDDIGNVYVCDSKNGCIRKFNRHGNPSLPNMQLSGIASDTRAAMSLSANKQELIVSPKKWESSDESKCYCTTSLEVFNLDSGSLTRTVPITQFNGIHGLTTNDLNEIIFSDPQRKIICTMDQNGKVNQAFKTHPERFSVPGEIAGGPSHTLFIVDHGKDCVQAVRQVDGSVVRRFVPTYCGQEMRQISCISSDAGQVFVAGRDRQGSCLIFKCAADGQGMGILAGADMIGKIGGLAISKAGRVWVSDVKQSSLVKFKSVNDIIGECKV